ncbi:MAG: serine hydrolase [Anaerolineaceae bacterium]|nr:serine hydrolase [Anaerolineaceae bacterium]
MNKSHKFDRLVLVFLGFALLLQACQPSVQVDLTATPTITQEASQTPTSTSSPSPTATEIPLATPTLPPEISVEDIKNNLGEVLIEGVDWHVIIENESGERLFERNPAELFHPASTIKVPVALVVLKILEERGDSLEKIQSYGIGRSWAELVSAMIVKSEEAATESLEFFARGDNRLRNYLDEWGLRQTTFDPRLSTAEDLLLSLKVVNNQEVLSEEFNNFLLELMGEYTENDETLLGVLSAELPQCKFFNKRGTLTNPMVVADMGILKCTEQTWYLVIAGTPQEDSAVKYEAIQAAIENFGKTFAPYAQAKPES